MYTIIYASFSCSSDTFRNLFENATFIPGQAVQKYNRLIMEGLALMKQTKVKAVVEAPISRKTHKQLFWREKNENIKNIEYHYIFLLNIRWMKDVFAVISSFFYTINSINIENNSGDYAVIADVLNAPVALGAYWAAKKKKIKYMTIVTDVPEMGGSGKIYSKVSNYLIHRADCYAFITEYMNQKYNLNNKPYMVLEGVVDSSEASMEKGINGDEKFIVLYSGSINKIYGVELLVRGFIEAEIPNSELHIFGDGDLREELKIYSQRYENIFYFGTVLADDIVKRQKMASLLVNPRPIVGEYIKYSFPSKNMEYMASGTPVLTTNLLGMPKEYKEYVYLLDDYTVEGISKRLMEISQISEEVRNEMGMRAERFVKCHKNKISRAREIMDVLSWRSI